MKKLLLILTICTLSGCGLFRKKTKVSNSSENNSKTEIRTEVEEQIQLTAKSESETRSNEQTQLQKDIDEQTAVAADEIEIRPDGTVKASGNAKLSQNTKDRSKLEQSKQVDSNDRQVGQVEYKSAGKEQNNQESKEEVKNVQSQTEPKGSIWIWVAVGLLLLIGGLLFLRKKGVI
ncbi:hypothetical protein [Sphingobacterium thalpophilum]|uniref:hypothetical protein n=1 Tax=Sphingobacterium thalpophilum TaxID=259 RepID=UPI0024A78AEB|nr:hypothetical protein [Sphingobacterium thalpophilum]